MARSRWQGSVLGLLMAIAPTAGPALANNPTSLDRPPVTQMPTPTQAPTQAPRIQPTQITLLDPGTGDRQPLRLRLRVGDRQQALLVIKSKMRLMLPQQPAIETPTPEMRLTTAVQVDRVEPNGDVAYTLSYPKIEMIAPAGTPASVQAAMNQSAREMQGMRIRLQGNDRGGISAVNFDFDKPPSAVLQAALAQMTDSIRNSNIEFPAEPIGLGGRWRATTSIEANGLRINQRAIYQVTELTPDRVVLSVTVEQTAPSQKLMIPGVPVAQAPNLRSYAATGSGQLRMDFNRSIPTQSNLTLNLRSEMDLPTAADPISVLNETATLNTVSMTGEMQMTLESLP
ncbi:MAG TPA: hypothetical protein V6D46_01335 [Coleofasciculaceae cyanobacterium]